MRTTAIISTGWKRTGVVLKTVEIGRWEIVGVSRRVLIINLLGHDRRGWRMGHGRRRYHEGESALSRRCSRDWWVVRARHWRGHGWKTGRNRERVSHLVVRVRGPSWAGWGRALRRRWHGWRVRYKVWSWRHKIGSLRIRERGRRGTWRFVLILHRRLLRMKKSQILGPERWC